MARCSQTASQRDLLGNWNKAVPEQHQPEADTHGLQRKRRFTIGSRKEGARFWDSFFVLNKLKEAISNARAETEKGLSTKRKKSSKL